jgi:hypothetical protein
MKVILIMSTVRFWTVIKERMVLLFSKLLSAEFSVIAIELLFGAFKAHIRQIQPWYKVSVAATVVLISTVPSFKHWDKNIDRRPVSKHYIYGVF